MVDSWAAQYTQPEAAAMFQRGSHIVSKAGTFSGIHYWPGKACHYMRGHRGAYLVLVAPNTTLVENLDLDSFPSWKWFKCVLAFGHVL
jgi:hypothetical protein